MTRLSNRTALLNWLFDHAGDRAETKEISAMADAIQKHKDRPRWGADWTEFLSKLPENLYELIDD